MAPSAQSGNSSTSNKPTLLKTPDKIDIHGIRRSSCSNCTECPQFVSIPGHVLCAYCGCPPARHGKAALKGDLGPGKGTSRVAPSVAHGDRKRGRDADANSVEKGERGLADSEQDSDVSSDSEDEDSSSGVSSFTSKNEVRKQKRWRPTGQVTAAPPRVSRLLESDPVGREEQLEHTWNELDSSPNIYIKQDDPLTFHRNPVYQTTDAIRGKAGDEWEGYSSGLHVWTVHWPSPSRGTHPVVGVATSECHLTEPGYKRLVGSTSTSWGWCLKSMKVYHDSRKFRQGVPYPRDIDQKLKVPDTFFMILDMDRGTLAFQVNDDFLGVAFSGLRGEELFPIVSAVWGHCEVTLTYIGSNYLERERSST